MSIVKDALVEAIRAKAQQAITYKNKLDTAKTKPKQIFYSKKLKKNNQEAMQLLLALDKLAGDSTGAQVTPPSR